MTSLFSICDTSKPLIVTLHSYKQLWTNFYYYRITSNKKINERDSGDSSGVTTVCDAELSRFIKVRIYNENSIFYICICISQENYWDKEFDRPVLDSLKEGVSVFLGGGGDWIQFLSFGSLSVSPAGRYTTGTDIISIKKNKKSCS